MRAAAAATAVEHEGAERTRERLLDAAEKLFAARGFRATSVRHITAEAGCNLAAVNYHFGDKVGLYREMFHRRLGALRQRRIASLRRAVTDAGERASLETLLRAFTTSFLEPHLDESGGRRLMQLMTREMLDPHLRPRTFEKEMLAPVQEAMSAAMRRLCPGLGGRAARRCAHSVVAQLVHVVQMRHNPKACGGMLQADFAFPEVVDHIIRFSVAGIRGSQH